MEKRHNDDKCTQYITIGESNLKYLLQMCAVDTNKGQEIVIDAFRLAGFPGAK